MFIVLYFLVDDHNQVMFYFARSAVITKTTLHDTIYKHTLLPIHAEDVQLNRGQTNKRALTGQSENVGEQRGIF